MEFAFILNYVLLGRKKHIRKDMEKCDPSWNYITNPEITVSQTELFFLKKFLDIKTLLNLCILIGFPTLKSDGVAKYFLNDWDLPSPDIGQIFQNSEIEHFFECIDFVNKNIPAWINSGKIKNHELKILNNYPPRRIDDSNYGVNLEILLSAHEGLRKCKYGQPLY